MPSSPSSRTRRGFLALCGASVAAGCSIPFLHDDAVSLSVPDGAGDWPASAGKARRTRTNAAATGPTGPVEAAWTAADLGGRVAVSTADDGDRRTVSVSVDRSRFTAVRRSSPVTSP